MENPGLNSVISERVERLNPLPPLFGIQYPPPSSLSPSI